MRKASPPSRISSRPDAMIPGRSPNGLEVRRVAELRTAGRRLEGYAAVFNAEARIGDFRETIRPGAFRASLLAQSDVLALVDHDPGRLLARTGSGTLRLSEDARGLSFSLDVPDTTLGRDVLALASRGDLGGMSFGFRVTDENWPTRDQRELRAVDLAEISVVHAWPAYDGTSVAARAQDARLAALHRRRLLDMS
jgi:HK97 family phage prohead protease